MMFGQSEHGDWTHSLMLDSIIVVPERKCRSKYSFGNVQAEQCRSLASISTCVSSGKFIPKTIDRKYLQYPKCCICQSNHKDTNQLCASLNNQNKRRLISTKGVVAYSRHATRCIGSLSFERIIDYHNKANVCVSHIQYAPKSDRCIIWILINGRETECYICEI